jgi:hypothetical protein
MAKYEIDMGQLPDILVNVMEKRIIQEFCPKCKSSVGQLCAIDEPGEDCNFFDQLKDYKFTQRTANPHTCTCGTKLVPQVG